MHFETFADFINMGGHGLFVWSVYGLGIGILLFNIIRPSLLQRRFFQQQSRVLNAMPEMATPGPVAAGSKKQTSKQQQSSEQQ